MQTSEIVRNAFLDNLGTDWIAVAANGLGLNRIDYIWFRNGARLGAAVVGASMLKGDLGASMAGIWAAFKTGIMPK